MPSPEDMDSFLTDSEQAPLSQEIPIGRLIFPGYDESNKGNKTWMKQVYMYVGKHQRLTGEVKKLPKAIAIIRKRITNQQGEGEDEDVEMDEAGDREENVEELEVVEIVKYKIIFSTRPEPVGTAKSEPVEAFTAGDEI